MITETYQYTHDKDYCQFEYLVSSGSVTSDHTYTHFTSIENYAQTTTYDTAVLWAYITYGTLNGFHGDTHTPIRNLLPEIDYICYKYIT